MWILSLFMANISIMFLEWTYRLSASTSFVKALPVIIIPILISQAGIFYGFKLAPNLLLAGAMFTLINMLLRVFNVWRLGEPMNMYTGLGVGCLVVSLIFFKLQ